MSHRWQVYAVVARMRRAAGGELCPGRAHGRATATTRRRRGNTFLIKTFNRVLSKRNERAEPGRAAGRAVYPIASRNKFLSYRRAAARRRGAFVNDIARSLVKSAHDEKKLNANRLKNLVAVASRRMGMSSPGFQFPV